jgi:hypothetical protein
MFSVRNILVCEEKKRKHRTFFLTLRENVLTHITMAEAVQDNEDFGASVPYEKSGLAMRYPGWNSQNVLEGITFDSNGHAFVSKDHPIVEVINNTREGQTDLGPLTDADLYRDTDTYKVTEKDARTTLAIVIKGMAKLGV